MDRTAAKGVSDPSFHTVRNCKEEGDDFSELPRSKPMAILFSLWWCCTGFKKENSSTFLKNIIHSEVKYFIIFICVDVLGFILDPFSN